MRTATAILLALSTATPTLAADAAIAISAGEHKDFSRIAFPNTKVGVTVEQSGRTVTIRNIDPKAAYNLSDINERQKAYRISGAKPVSSNQGKAIELKLNCDCTIRTTTLGNGKFVLDVVETGAAKPKKVESDTSEDEKARRAAERVGKPPSKEDMLSIEQAHSQMVSLLKQAAKEGLITIKGENGSTAETSTTALKGPTELAPTNTLEEPAVDTSPINTASTDTKPTPTPVIQASARKTIDAICYSDAKFAIDGSAFDEEPLVAIADLQAALVEEEGSAKARTANKLVSGFLSIGFGEEALSLLKDNNAEDSLYADLARVIAERPLDPYGPLQAAENCRGAHALWQAAASDPQLTLSFYKQSSAAVETLPRRLRAMIATRIAIKLIAAGGWEAAEELYQIAAASVETPGPDLEYVRARLDQHGENPEAARDALLEIASSNSVASDDALLALADSYAKREATPHDGFTEDIGALAKLGGSSQATIAEADAWAKLGNVDAALFLLQSVAQKSEPELQLARQSAQSIFDDAFTSGDEQTRIAALDAFLKNKSWFAPGQSANDVKLQGARASQDFGLPNLAYDLMDDIADHNDKDFIKGKAIAALDAGNVDAAIRIAAPYASDPEFAEILVNASIEGGNYNAALAAAAALPEDNKKAALTARAAWLARSWRSAAGGFRTLDPSLLNEAAAVQFALSAYKMNEAAMPAAVDAVLSEEQGNILNGLRSLFAESPKGSTLQRSRQTAINTDREIQMIQEVLNDG